MDGLRAMAMAMAENWTVVETKVGNVAIQDPPLANGNRAIWRLGDDGDEGSDPPWPRW